MKYTRQDVFEHKETKKTVVFVEYGSKDVIVVRHESGGDKFNLNELEYLGRSPYIVLPIHAKAGEYYHAYNPLFNKSVKYYLMTIDPSDSVPFRLKREGESTTCASVISKVPWSSIRTNLYNPFDLKSDIAEHFNSVPIYDHSGSLNETISSEVGLVSQPKALI